jgi:hypothetical protein
MYIPLPETKKRKIARNKKEEKLPETKKRRKIA